MPNGHGGIPWFGSPILLLVVLSALAWLRFSHDAAWTLYAAHPIAALFAWRFAWHLCLYRPTEYGGGYTSDEEMRKARARYYTLSAVLIPLAILAVQLLWQ